MKISITAISLAASFRCGDMDLAGFLEYAAKLELDAVDLLDCSCYPWFWKNWEQKFKEISTLIQANGLQLAAYATGNNFAKTDPKEREYNVDIVKKAIAEAAELGAKTLRIFGGHHRDSGGESSIDSSTGLAMILEGIEKCLETAASYQVVLALENHGRLPRYSYEQKAVVQQFNSPWLQTTFDCGNYLGKSVTESEDPLMAYHNLRKQIAHVHIKDLGPDNSENPWKLTSYVSGTGTVPLAQIIAAMENDGYQGFYSLEYEAAAMTPEKIGIPQSIEYLKSLRKTHKLFQNKR